MKRQISPINQNRGEGVIKIHIGELVLKGLPMSAARSIQDFVEHELAAQLTRQGISMLPSSERHIERIDGGSFPLPQDAHANAVGREIAGSILRALELAGEDNAHAKGKLKT
jgi:hypothetical protein